MSVRIKRAYERPAESDGLRILVDRVWPRGIRKERLKLYRWERDVAPSTKLRQWFAHDPAKWAAFLRKYRAELKSSKALTELRRLVRTRRVTLVYSAKDERHNQAAALRQFLMG